VAYIFVPRDNATLQIKARLHNATRNISIYIFSGTDDVAFSYSKPPLHLLEVKLGDTNEFNIDLPGKGWYSVSSCRAVYVSSKYDYNIRVDMWVWEGYQMIPFVVKSWNDEFFVL
jgi:hypothetical protein